MIGSDGSFSSNTSRNARTNIAWVEAAPSSATSTGTGTGTGTGVVVVPTTLVFTSTFTTANDQLESSQLWCTPIAANPTLLTMRPTANPNWATDMANATGVAFVFNLFGANIPHPQDWNVIYIHASPAVASTYAWFVLGTPDKNLWLLLSKTPNISCTDTAILKQALVNLGYSWTTKQIMPQLCA